MLGAEAAAAADDLRPLTPPAHGLGHEILGRDHVHELPARHDEVAALGVRRERSPANMRTLASEARRQENPIQTGSPVARAASTAPAA